jgi:hypothetical protein
MSITLIEALAEFTTNATPAANASDTQGQRMPPISKSVMRIVMRNGARNSPDPHVFRCLVIVRLTRRPSDAAPRWLPSWRSRAW